MGLQYNFSELDMGELRDRTRGLKEQRRGMKMYVLALGLLTGYSV